MANIISYVDVIECFKSISKRHHQLKTFFLGKNWNLGEGESITYPCIQVYPEVATLPITQNGDYKTIEIKLNVKVIDLVRMNKSNELDVDSDMLRIAQDIINEFNQHPFYQRSNANLVGDINLTNLSEYNSDGTSGWEFGITLKLINNNTFCGLPIEDITGYSAAGPTYTGYSASIQYLTCDTVTGCTTLQAYIQEQIDSISTDNFYTTGATLSGQTIIFNRTDLSNAYSINLAPLLTGATFSGTTNYYAKFNSGATIGNGLVYDNGTSTTYITGINNNTGLVIASPPGFYYPSLAFANTGTNYLGGISAYNNTLYIGGAGAPVTPLTVSSVVAFPYLTGNSLTYLNASNVLQNAGLGFGLQLNGSILSVTGTSGTYLTGFTYDNANTFTILNSTGGTLSASFNLVTGLTVTGLLSASTLSVSSSSNLYGNIYTSFSGSTNRIVESGPTGALTATKDLIDSFLSPGTAATLLTTSSNWNASKNYTGTTITGTYQGQQYYDANYYFIAVNDNDWIRIPRI